MKSIKTIIIAGVMSILMIAGVMSILMIGTTNAYVTSGEYVTHNDWNRMVASMSEILEYLSEEYIYKLCEENPKLKKIRDRAEEEALKNLTGGVE